MADDWVRLCRGREFDLSPPEICVHFADGRAHRVQVEERLDAYHLSAVVVRRAVVESLPDLPIKIWRRNRESTLVTYRIDQKRRLVGEAWVPRAGVTPEEMQLYVRTLAEECDRLEYLLTGKDRE
ncbi:MAG: YbjN domain-containing protein [Polyangiaceae bacterium]